MAQNITLLGASYTGVPSILLPKTGGGQASFTDVTDTTATASDVASGKYFYAADGTRTLGTASGGGGVLSVDFDLVNGTWTADKTFAEIKSAYLSGSTIVITANNLPEGTARGDYDPDADCVYVTINYYDYGNSKEFTQWLIYDSGGIQDDGDVAYINEPTQTINISANGTYNVTTFANAEVNVSGGGGGTIKIGTKTATASNYPTSLSFTGLSGKPVMFAVKSTSQISSSGSTTYYYIIDMVMTGEGTAHGNCFRIGSTRRVDTISSGYTWTYSSGTLTLHTSASSRSASPGAFNNGYKLIYAYEE